MPRMTFEVIMDFEFELRLLDDKGEFINYMILRDESIDDAQNKADRHASHLVAHSKHSINAEFTEKRKWYRHDVNLEWRKHSDCNGYLLSLVIKDFGAPRFTEANMTYEQGNRTDSFCAYPKVVTT